MEAVLLWVGAFILGSVPFGYLLARLNGIDIRQVGSGNIGATNVERALGKRMGALVLMLDILKALVPALFGWHLVSAPEWVGGQQELAFGAGFAAVMGHCFSPFLKFNGGKGVASGIGSLFGACWPVALIVLGTFIVVFAASRYVSLGSIFGALVIVPGALICGIVGPVLIPMALMTVVVIWRHWPNIVRLRNGTEKRFGAKAVA